MNKWHVVPSHFQFLYENIIKDAIINEDVFNTFRSNPAYNTIVGNNMPSHEIKAYNNILLQSTFIQNKIDKIKLMDNIGTPDINYIGMASRNLKYMHTAYLIHKYFNNIKNVVEIGVGYGGLCYTLHTYFQLDGYTLLDLDYVLELTKKFLNKLNLTPNNAKEPYDIGISECALTELNDETIISYYEEYLQKCNKLLIRTNFIDNNKLKWFIDLIKKDYQIEMITDYPDAKEDPTLILGWHK